MNTRLSVNDAAPILSAYSGPDFMGRTNQVLDRLNNSGIWKGILRRSRYRTGTEGRGYFTLDRGDESIVGVTIGGVPMSIRSEFAPYTPNGYGWISEENYSCGPLEDMGDGYVVFLDISEDCTLRVKINDVADAGKTIRAFVKDQDGKVVYDSIGFEGLNIITASPSVDTTQVCSSIYGLQLPFFVGYVSLWQVVGGVETQIGTYAPGETRPCYRRYKTGIINEDVCLTVLCRRRFIPIVAPTDYIIPGNIGALKMGLQALVHEDAGRLEEAEGLWAKASQLLDQELTALRGSAQTTLRITMDSAPYAGAYGGYGYGGYGWGGGIPN